MSKSFVEQVGKDYAPDPQEEIVDSLFKQYERVIVESIVTSFGMDFLLFHNADQHGGDVDTIHSVREIGKDPKMAYKSMHNKEVYDTRGAYIYDDYHGKRKGSNYQKKKEEVRAAGEVVGSPIPIKDEYTGKTIYMLGKSKNAPPGLSAEPDHVLTAKTIHDDRGRVLSGLKGTDLSDAPENLQWTNKSLNASMGATKENGEPVDIPRYIELHPELADETKANMMRHYNAAKASYEAKIAQAYYTSPQFVKDTAVAAGKVAAGMGMRQVFGFVFMEIWFAVKEEFEKAKKQDDFDLELFLKALAEGIKRGAINAKNKYKDLIEKFGEGAVAGALGSITTTLCNIFFTTAKSAVRIIRQTWASLTEATKILLFNPDNLLFGERFRAATKVLAAGASVVLGQSVQAVVSEALAKTPLVSIPLLYNRIPGLCGVLLTGIMSCTLLYFLDHSKVINSAIHKLNEVPSVELSIMEFKQQAAYFEKYAAELMQIDLKKFQEEVDAYVKATEYLEQANDDAGLNRALKFAYEKLGIALPWQGDFDAFMSDKSAHLVFQ